MKKTFLRIAFLFATVLTCQMTWAAGGPPAPSSLSNPFVMTMVIIMIILALAIGLLANVVLGAAEVKAEREKAVKASGSTGVASAAIVIGLLFLVSPVFAQQTGTAAGSGVTTNGISDTAFYLMAAVIFLELIVIFFLLYNLKVLIAAEKQKLASEGSPAKQHLSWWDRFNKLKPIEQEVTIDLGHNYDGIRELDNRLPPWWLYGFYITILFAGIYLWRYHISHSAPLSHEELQIALKEADIEKQAYLKKSANLVDETNVKMLSAATDLDAGKTIFQTTCFPCHGKGGEGLVGPNLTDDYWVHGGGIKDIFKTIKYGFPDKGMKSWKDDYTPLQIAQLASYIKSLHGTNPPNQKAPQGTLSTETESSAAGDSTAVKGIDSSKSATVK